MAFAAAILALAVRLTVRDTSPWSAWIYYATPPLLIAAAFLVASTASLVLGARRAALAGLSTAALVVLVWLGLSYRWNDCIVTEDELRVLMWNVSRKAAVDAAVAEEVAAAVRDFDPHVIGLVEAGPDAARYVARWRAAFPAYSVEMPREHLAVLWKGELASADQGELEGISRYTDVFGMVEGIGLHLLLVDLDASPRFDKRRIADEIFRLAAAGGDLPTIVMGDFNTPLDSRAFRRVRGGFSHAFEEAGRGLPMTWPSRLPMVSIDHVWLSPELQPTCTSLVTVDGYDHRQVRVRIARPVSPSTAR